MQSPHRFARTGEVLIFCVFLEHVVKLLLNMFFCFFNSYQIPTVQNISQKSPSGRPRDDDGASSLSTRQGNIYPNSTRFPFHVRRGSHILRISRTLGQTIDHKGGTQTMMKAFLFLLCMLLPPPQKRTRCMFVEQKNISAYRISRIHRRASTVQSISVFNDFSNCIELYWAAFVCIELYWAAVSCIVLHWSALNCIELHWAALSCTDFWRFIVELALSKT